MTRGNTTKILSMLAATNLLCCLTVMAGEYICTSACQVYTVGGNRAVAELKEGKKVHGEPDATGQWLIVNGKNRQYSVDLSHFVTAEQADTLAKEKEQAREQLDARIQEIRQQLHEMEGRTAQEQSMNQRPSPRTAPGEENGELERPNEPSRTIVVTSNKSTLEKWRLEKELERLETKRESLYRG